MRSLLQDLRYSVRGIRKSPAFAAAAIATLAVGIGATTAIFSVTDAVLLRPLPFPQPELGCLASLAATRLLASLLYEVRPTDPITYLAIAAVMLAVGFFSGAIPARRAARTDPLEALRSE